MSSSRRAALTLLLGVLVIALAAWLSWRADGGAQVSQSTSAASPSASGSATATVSRTPLAGATPNSGLTRITESSLPSQARQTLALIFADGPFPYRQDGATFQNREGLLPRQPRGYYREYTVVTPGEGDRGARRIIGGEDGDLYYTDDHYDSFAQIDLGR